MEFIRISRQKNNDFAPKGGKRILEEERERRSNMHTQVMNDPSIALISAIQSNKIDQSNSSLVQNLSFVNNMSRKHIQEAIESQPKSVLEWIQKTEYNPSSDDGSGKSPSLMKRAQE